MRRARGGPWPRRFTGGGGAIWAQGPFGFRHKEGKAIYLCVSRDSQDTVPFLACSREEPISPRPWPQPGEVRGRGKSFGSISGRAAARQVTPSKLPQSSESAHPSADWWPRGWLTVTVGRSRPPRAESPCLPCVPRPICYLSHQCTCTRLTSRTPNALTGTCLCRQA